MNGIATKPEVYDVELGECGDCGRMGGVVVKLAGRDDCYECGNEILLCADCLAKLKADLEGFPATDDKGSA